MRLYRNDGDDTVVFRDDAGKHFVKPGDSFVLVGDQHAPMVEALAGVQPQPDPEPVPADATLADLEERAADLGVKPASRRKADVRAAVVAVAGESPADEGAPV